jgi:hypothetical protein
MANRVLALAGSLARMDVGLIKVPAVIVASETIAWRLVIKFDLFFSMYSLQFY